MPISEYTDSNPLGVVLINTGTPDSPDPKDIKPYLTEFLSDKNIGAMPKFIWLPILHCFILPRRPKITSERYKLIWTKEGSPFILGSLAQCKKLEAALHSEGVCARVELGMRYGNPSIENAFYKLRNNGCKHIVCIPLYPQTAYCTTKTCIEKVREIAAKISDIQTSCVNGYTLREDYLTALAQSIKENWEYTPGSKLLFAFHSVPTIDIKHGDTYEQEVRECVARVVDKLGIPEEDWAIGFQSRFEDSRKWIGPNPKVFLAKWAYNKINRVAVVTPGFATDCLETLYDCDILQRASFTEACKDAGTTADFTYIPALNDCDSHIAVLAALVREKAL